MKVGKRKLRSLLFENRRNIKALEKEGVSRQELRDAVDAVRADGQLKVGGDIEVNASLIAAELADSAQLPMGPNWDKIIELIEKLMPLIETWIAMCV